MSTSNSTPTKTELISAVEAAILAPSMHNSQPWRFRVGERHIEVYEDPDRLLRVADPHGRGVRLACGAAVFNLRLAIAMLGHEPEVSLFSGHRPPHLLARVALGRERRPTPEDRDLCAQIARRHSNRYPFRETPVPLEHRARLRATAQREGAWLDLLVGPAAIDAAAELVRAADRCLHHNPAYQAELAAWTRHDDEPSFDGVPRLAGGPAPEPHDLLARPNFGGPERPAGKDYETDPLVGVLGSFGDSATDQLTAGQALQRVLLTATRLGLVVSLISQPTDVAEVREQLRIGLGRYGAPQILLRIGYAGTPTTSTSRRPVSDVVDP